MRNKGFTLIELMIVVAIIAIIAAIAIPNLLRSRLQSNESAAIANLKTTVGAETAFAAANGGYTPDFADLNTAADGGPAYLDIELGAGIVQGYNYVLGAGTGVAVSATNAFLTNFACSATPAVATGTGATGIREFWVDAGGVIRLNADGSGEPI